MLQGLRTIRAVGLALVLPTAASAEVKEYQIRRMLMLKTECGVNGLAIVPRERGTMFTAECENVAHYPDGVEIQCPDTEDEHDCTIVTQKREFRHLFQARP